MKAQMKEITVDEYVELIEGDPAIETLTLGGVTLSKGGCAKYGEFVAISTCGGRYALIA